MVFHQSEKYEKESVPIINYFQSERFLIKLISNLVSVAQHMSIREVSVVATMTNTGLKNIS